MQAWTCKRRYTPVQLFIEWFLESKVIIIQYIMLWPAHEEGDLGSLHDAFYTNPIEDANNIIIFKVNYKHNDPPDIII